MSAPQLQSIQILRAVAAMLVVFAHALPRALTAFPIPGGSELAMLGGAGVDIFFVISGFVMVYITSDRAPDRAGFLLRRLVRVAPLYWICTLVVLLVAVAAPRYYTSKLGVPPLDFVIRSLLFIPVTRPVMNDAYPLLGVGWTLNLELVFYVLFGLTLGLARWRQIALLTVCLAGIAVLAAATTEPTSPFRQYVSGGIFLEFSLGMLIAQAHLAGIRLHRAGAAVVVVAGVALIVGGHALDPKYEWRLLSHGAGAALLVFGALLLEPTGPLRWAGRSLVKLGDASYALYLAHVPVVLAISRVGFDNLATVRAYSNFTVVLIALVAASIAVALLVHVVVEKPLTSFLQRLFGVSSGQSSAVLKR